jgi:hypothetical protein
MAKAHGIRHITLQPEVPHTVPVAFASARPPTA